MVYGPDGTEYPSWDAAVAAGVTNPSYAKPVATTASTAAPNIPTYGYELARLMAQYGVTSPTPPKTSDQSLINQYFAKINAPMYQEPRGNALFNQYLDIGLGRIPAPFGPMTGFFPGQAVCPSGQRYDPVTAKCIAVSTGTPNVGGNQCPPGFTFDAASKSCVPGPGTNVPVGNQPIGNTNQPVFTPPPVTPTPVTPAPVAPRPVTPVPVVPKPSTPAQPLPSLTDEEKAWIAKSKTFTDDQWREAMDAWIASNPNATKAQADAALLKFQAPERLYGYGYTEADLIDNPLVSAGFTPATQATQFVTPNAISGPGGYDIYKMFNENIGYAVDPRSIGGADISEQEAQQMWDIAKSQGLSVPQITEKVNLLANLNLSQGEVADIIRRLAPEEADAYFNLVGTDYDPSQRRFADGGLMQLAKKYQTGGLNTGDAQRRLDEASANLRQTIQSLAQQQETKGPSKAEMYFRLASAFATPTKTGDFGESLGLAAQQMAEYRGEQREAQKAAQQQRRDLAVELAKLDYETAQSAYEKAVAAQKPMGPIAQNCGDVYPVGSADYAACLQRGQEQADAEAAANLALREAQRANVVSQQAIREEKQNAPQTYTRFEQGLLDDYTKRLQSAKVAAGILAEAIKLNDDAYDESYGDIIRRFGSRIANQDDPKLAIYEFMRNRLSANALASLKATFPGAISNAEREALDSLQGALSTTKQGRAMIFQATMATMLDSIENANNELQKIADRYYAGPEQQQPEEPVNEVIE